MFRRKDSEQQPSIVDRDERSAADNGQRVYQRVDRALTKFGLARRFVRWHAALRERPASGGQPGIDPEVYFNMQMIGFFESLASERAIAARCADSLSSREFLHYALHERMPDDSSLTVIRQRLSPEVYEQVFGLILLALKRTSCSRASAWRLTLPCWRPTRPCARWSTA